jgi:hypothetical protein
MYIYVYIYIYIYIGGDYPCKYAMRFAAGFGSQIALALYGTAEVGSEGRSLI